MRAAFAVFALLGLIAGCSDTPPTKPVTKSSGVLGAKDKDAGKQDPLPGKSDEKAIAMLEQAIKAHGGMDALGQLASIERSVKGTNATQRRDVDFSADASIQLPDRIRTVASLDFGDVKQGETVVLDGNQGWQVNSGDTSPLSDERLRAFRDQLYAYGATILLPLRDNAVILETAGEDTVEGKPASVLRARAKDRPDMRLFFDKTSGLLVKMVYRINLAGGKADMEVRLLDYKDVDGAKVAHRQIESLNGGKLSEWTLTNIRVARKFDAALFSKP